MARPPNLDGGLDPLLRARGREKSFARRVVNQSLRWLSYRARAVVMPAVPLPDPPLSDGVVVLRRLSRDDAEGIRLASEDAEIARWAGAPALYRGRPDGFLVTAERDRKAGRAVTLAVEVADHAFSGAISLTCDWEHRKAEVSYWLNATARGKGFGSRAVRLAAKWAFEELRLERLEVLSNPENEASERLALRVGFAKEGVLRAYRLRNGGREDLALFSLLPADLLPAQMSR
jgi:RimJ/RimL family protein N-acetyltransferase